MMSFKAKFSFAFLLCLNFLIIIPQASGQQAYNHYALQYLKRSIECLMAGDYINAINNCNYVLRLDPNSAVTYVLRARAYYELNEYERAISDCSQAIRLDRDNGAAYLIRGNSYGQRGDHTRAIRDWEAALRVNPEINEARQNIELAHERGF